MLTDKQNKQLTILESVAMRMIEECHKTRIMMGGADRSSSRKGAMVDIDQRKADRLKRLSQNRRS